MDGRKREDWKGTVDDKLNVLTVMCCPKGSECDTRLTSFTWEITFFSSVCSALVRPQTRVDFGSVVYKKKFDKLDKLKHDK